MLNFAVFSFPPKLLSTLNEIPNSAQDQNKM